MRTIAIILGDNDFGSTFPAVLETLKRGLEYRERSLTLNELHFLVLEMAMGHYAAFQYTFRPEDYGLVSKLNGHDASLIAHEQHLARIRKYFTERLRVLVDEEAEQDIATGDHDGGAWYLQSGVIGRY